MADFFHDVPCVAALVGITVEGDVLRGFDCVATVAYPPLVFDFESVWSAFVCVVY